MGFAFRLAVSLYNHFYLLPMGADDAIRFHNSAVQKLSSLSFLDNLYDGWIYSSFLALIYYFTTPSILIASISSCVLWAISAFVLIKIFNLLNFSNANKQIGLLAYSFMPASIIFNSIALRESAELLIINAYILCLILIIKNNKYTYLPIPFLLSALIFFFHKGLIIFMLFSIIFFAVFLFTKITNYFFKNKILFLDFFFASAALFVFIILSLDLLGIASIGHLFDFLATNISSHQVNVPISRTTYLYTARIENLFTHMLSSVFFYFFSPMHYYIENFYDFVLYLENITRLILLGLVLNNFFYHKKNNQIFIILFLIYIGLEIMWAVGTANWGSASRHHIISYGLLVILAFFKKFTKLTEK